MAYVRNEYCSKHNKETLHIDNDGCIECLKYIKDEKDKVWEAQNIESKITDLRKRIEYLERPRIRF